MQEFDSTAPCCANTSSAIPEEAFAALVTRHVNKVYSVALRLTGNPHSAEEITQAVFVILAGNPGSWASGSSFPAGCIKPRG